MVNKNYHNFILYFKKFLRKFWCNLEKKIFDKQFKIKGEIRKSANGGLQLKIKIERG
jgi:hypothetical protein